MSVFKLLACVFRLLTWIVLLMWTAGVLWNWSKTEVSTVFQQQSAAQFALAMLVAGGVTAFVAVAVVNQVEALVVATVKMWRESEER